MCIDRIQTLFGPYFRLTIAGRRLDYASLNRAASDAQKYLRRMRRARV